MQARTPEIFPRGKKTPRPDIWCHPEKPYGAKGLCISCYGRLKNSRRPKIYSARYRRSHLKRTLEKHGLSLSDFDRMLKLQNGVCAICSRPPIGKTRLSIDHEHSSGKVRGLLCDPCNRALGYFQDNPEWCVLGADYLLGAKLQHGV